MDIKEYLEQKKPLIDKEMERVVPRIASKQWMESALGKAAFSYDVETISKSMTEPVWEYLDRGGKRWRPGLVLLAAEAVGAKEADAMPFTPLVELVHNGCVTGDTVILSAEGVPKKITEFRKGEKVLSVAGDGSIVTSPIAATFDNGIKDVYCVKTRNREITATENHPFLVVSKEQPVRAKITEYGRLIIGLRLAQFGTTISQFSDKIYSSLKHPDVSGGHLKNALYGFEQCLLPLDIVELISATLLLDTEKCWQKRKCNFGKAEIKLDWKELKDLKTGDLIVVSKETATEGGAVPKIPAIKQSPRDRNRIPEEFSIELAQLCGFILGDGCVCADGRVHLCIPEDQPGRAGYLALTEQVFKARPSISKNTIVICSKAISAIFKKLGFAKHALEKEIPDWVFRLPKAHKLAFVKGYLDSDGSVSKKGTVVFECASKKIIAKMKVLLDSMGFVTGNVTERKVSNTHFKRKVNKTETILYRVILSSRNRVLKEIGSEIVEYRTRLGVTAQREVKFRFSEQVPSMPAGFSEKEFGFNKILGIKHLGKEHTYDLQIDKTHNYISNGVVTHNTLCCDDVEDDSKLRRGKPCMHLIHGVDIAINNGCALYFLPLTLLYRNTHKLDSEKLLQIYDLYGEEMLRVSMGQAMDILWHKGNKENISEAEYLQMVVYKTGVLARFAAKLGAILGNATKEQIGAFGKFGEALGIGFQIQDDILELTGEEFKKGKGSEGGDIHEGKRTLLVIKTLEKASAEDRVRLLEILNSHPTDEERIKEAVDIIEKYGAIDYAREKGNKIVEDAWKQIDSMLPESEAKITLKSLASYCIQRKI